MINNTTNILLKANENIFEKGIWPIIEKNRLAEWDLTSINNKYKLFNTILQPINSLKNNNIFCFEYTVYEGCSICTIPKTNINC